MVLFGANKQKQRLIAEQTAFYATIYPPAQTVGEIREDIRRRSPQTSEMMLTKMRSFRNQPSKSKCEDFSKKMVTAVGSAGITLVAGLGCAFSLMDLSVGNQRAHDYLQREWAVLKASATNIIKGIYQEI